MFGEPAQDSVWPLYDLWPSHNVFSHVTVLRRGVTESERNALTVCWVLKSFIFVCLYFKRMSRITEFLRSLGYFVGSCFKKGRERRK